MFFLGGSIMYCIVLGVCLLVELVFCMIIWKFDMLGNKYKMKVIFILFLIFDINCFNICYIYIWKYKIYFYLCFEIVYIDIILIFGR